MPGLPDQLSAKDKFRTAASKWNDLKGTQEEERYNSIAKSCPKVDPSSLTGDSAKAFFHKQELKLSKLLSSLEQVGYQSALLVYSKSNGAAYKLGTGIGVQFLESNPQVGLDFMSFVAGGHQKATSKSLRLQVRCLFNQIYKKVTGVSPMCYGAFSDGRMGASGLPDGVQVGDIKSFSLDVMAKIIATGEKNGISFFRLQPAAVAGAPVLGPSTTITDLPQSAANVHSNADYTQATAAIGPSSTAPTLAISAIQSSTAPTSVTADILSSNIVPISFTIDLLPSNTATTSLTTTILPSTTATTSLTTTILPSTTARGSVDSKRTSVLRPRKRAAATVIDGVKRKCTSKTAANGIKALSAENVFEAEKIIDQRYSGRSIQYKVKWIGYDDTHNSWEPAANIIDQRLVQNWMAIE